MKSCFKEWNAIIEALGQGKQSVLIRKFSTLKDEFLLYPTVSYINNDNYLSNFNSKYKTFVEDNALPNSFNNNVELKYYAKVEKIKKISPKSVSSYQNHYIWNKEHVKSYLDNKQGYIWLLRVYKLPKNVMAKTKRHALTFALVNKEIKTDGSKPVLNKSEFNKIKENI